MQIFKKNGIVLFWALLFADCLFIFLEKLDYHTYLKPLLIPTLVFYIISNTKKNKYKRSKILVIVGLFCSWIGDILLLNEGEAFFIAGSLAFVATHIFYAIFFYRVTPIKSNKSYEALIIATFVMIGIFFLVNSFLRNDIPAYFTLPFYIYIIAIGIMSILAANLYSDRVRKKLALTYFIPGALLFIVSDATLATHQFKYVDEQFLDVIVMLTYGYAQCFMAQGFTKYLKG